MLVVGDRVKLSASYKRCACRYVNDNTMGAAEKLSITSSHNLYLSVRDRRWFRRLFIDYGDKVGIVSEVGKSNKHIGNVLVIFGTDIYVRYIWFDDKNLTKQC